jgi:DNA-binding CsgD family transcriptional regulator/tetratricopeptide (TPR) repeat protein
MTDSNTLCPTIVGRGGVLASLADAIAEARTGRGTTIAIAGEAGVGKSRVLAEVRTRATGSGLTVLEVRCSEFDRTVPYAPLLATLRGAAARGIVRPSEPVRGPHELVALIPELAALLPELGSLPIRHTAEERRRFFEALCGFLCRAASRVPIVLTIEDVHWIDDASLQFVTFLAREIRPHPFLLLLTYRNEEASGDLRHALADLERQRLARAVPLERLSREETAEMLGAMLGPGRLVSAEFVEIMFSLTDGNPFFVEEVVKSLVAAGGLRGADAAPSVSLKGLPIPTTIQDAVVRRTAALRLGTRQTLVLAAVAGRQFDFALLVELQGCDENALLEQMKELIDAQLVVEVSAEQFAFRHALTRHAIYAELLGRERMALHQRIAEAIERLGASALDGHWADLAAHYFDAGVWHKAFDYACLAGERAQQLYAPEVAVEQYSRALDAAARLATMPPVRVYRARGRAFETIGEFDRARADFEQTLELARVAGDRPDEWRSLLDLAELWGSRDFARSGEWCRRALELARTMNSPETLARSLNRLGNWYVNVEQPLLGRTHHEEALTIFERVDDRRGIAETLDLLGMCLLCSGDMRAAVRTFEVAAAALRELDDRYALVLCLTLLAVRAGDHHFEPLAFDPSDFARAVEAGEEALSLAREIQWRSGESFAAACLAPCLATRGEYEQAFRLARDACAIATEIEHPQRLAFAEIVLGELYLDVLAFPTARLHLEQALALVRGTNSLIWSNMAGGALVAACVGEGDLERAEVFLAARPEPAGPPSSFTQRLLACSRVELALARGDPRRALELADELALSLQLARDGQHERVGPPHLTRLRALALAALRRHDEAEALLVTQRQAALKRAALPQLWRTELALSTVHRARGQRETSERARAAARTTVEELAARLPSEPVEGGDGYSLQENFTRRAALLPSPSVEPTPTARRGGGGLTRREHEVLRLVAVGHSDREIAHALTISVRTVEHHVSSILTKTGVPRRSGIAAYALRHGLLSPEELR